MRRREFIASLGSAVAWPLAARAQRSIPVIGYLGFGTPGTEGERFAEVQRGLSNIGFIEGRNLTVEYLWAGNHLDLIPALASELVRRQVSLIFVNSTAAALAAKNATRSIPIVFSIGGDPVEAGLVASLNRPGGNITGTYNLNISLAAKRLELLHEVVPAAATIAYLNNPANPVVAAPETKELQTAARTLGVRLVILNASSPGDFSISLESLARNGAGALLLSSDVFFTDHTDQLVALATRYRVPVMYSGRNAAAAGGLVSYGNDGRVIRRQDVTYIARVLAGTKPADLPVQQVTKIELVVNTKTAKWIGLTVPESVLLRADEVIQ